MQAQQKAASSEKLVDKTCSRIDMGVKRFVVSKDGGPKWKKVWKKDTYNLEDGKLIAEELIIHMTRKNLTRPLPDGVKNIKT
eukprot:4009139-Amphidinium_carterae.1